MRIETERIIIRSIERGDEMVFAEMAKDGSLHDIGFDANVPSWKTAEKAGFVLEEKRMYKDIDDSEEQLYRFYSIKR